MTEINEYLDKERIIPLVESVSEVLSNFRNDVEKCLF